MKNKIILNYINKVLENMPKNWLNLTTHRLDIYDEKLAKNEPLYRGTKFVDKSGI